ncbi:MAG: HAMP domain-containing histidine kinase, partial [Ignavibacteriaceae bacterium]|nr:HAMP domain-containing histidine kinase [Ignavibacteriaceae bacterium]
MIRAPEQRISILLFFVVLLPAVIYSVYELTSVKEEEELLQAVYTNQLETILFSVNQYTEDVITNLSFRLDNSLLSDRDLEAAFREKSSVFSIVKYSVYTGALRIINPGMPGTDQAAVKKFVDSVAPGFNQLIDYKKSGYRKLEAYSFLPDSGYTAIFFVPDSPDPGYNIYGFFIDSRAFIREVLSPKIQNLSQNEFLLPVLDTRRKEIVYQNDTTSNVVTEIQKDLWLLPGYKIGIAKRGVSIREIVKERVDSSLLLILMLNIVLISGVIFVFYNIRKFAELVKMRSDFVSNVSHELRTPLALIRMFAETLEMGRARTEVKKREYISIISGETQRLSNIVNRILNFSQMEAGKRKFHFAPIDLNDTISSLFETYKFHLQNNGFSFTAAYAPDLPPINADAEAVTEAVINLLDNAVKYSDDVKEITIRTGRSDNFQFIEVRDRGIGIKKEDQKKIFEKFYRVTSGQIHNTKGSGLGLSLVNQIAHAHKGKIEVISSYGKGSLFRIYLLQETGKQETGKQETGKQETGKQETG